MERHYAYRRGPGNPKICDMQRTSLQSRSMDTKADRLRAARVARGFASAADAARALNIPYGTYSGHENNSRGFKDDEAERYADFFKVSIGWLIAGEGFSVPLISWVSAGGLLTADAVINLDDSTLLPIAGLPPTHPGALRRTDATRPIGRPA